MGMDLVPINKDRINVAHLQYNWSGWRWIIDRLNKWGVDIEEFKGVNDGHVISEETCKKVADALEQHLPELEKDDQEWLSPHVAAWRTCGGYEQW